jgi:hypothetical protein
VQGRESTRQAKEASLKRCMRGAREISRGMKRFLKFLGGSVIYYRLIVDIVYKFLRWKE